VSPTCPPTPALPLPPPCPNRRRKIDAAAEFFTASWLDGRDSRLLAVGGFREGSGKVQGRFRDSRLLAVGAAGRIRVARSVAVAVPV